MREEEKVLLTKRRARDARDADGERSERSQSCTEERGRVRKGRKASRRRVELGLALA